MKAIIIQKYYPCLQTHLPILRYLRQNTAHYRQYLAGLEQVAPFAP